MLSTKSLRKMRDFSHSLVYAAFALSTMGLFWMSYMSQIVPAEQSNAETVALIATTTEPVETIVEPYFGPTRYAAALIGVATTSFDGSSETRIHNIRLGAERISHKRFEQHSTFSLLTELGYITEQSGFKKEYVIEGDRSIQGVGGGLCQLSTTVFRAALNAGLPIVERKGHSYVVQYYGPGLDATIYNDSPDLRFFNDTGNPVFIEATASGTDLTVHIYGTPDGRIATTTNLNIYNRVPAPPIRYVENPELAYGTEQCTDSSREGMTTDITYNVMYQDGTLRTKEFTTHYAAWPGFCYRNTQTKTTPPIVASSSTSTIQMPIFQTALRPPQSEPRPNNASL